MNGNNHHDGDTTMTDSTRNMEIAQTICQQIGGRALMMIGGKQKVAIENGVDIKVGKGAKHPTGGKVTHLRIVLDEASDTYTFEAIRCNVRAKEMVKVLERTEGVYVDMLHEMIERSTGFYTSF